jgi:Ku protein
VRHASSSSSSVRTAARVAQRDRQGYQFSKERYVTFTDPELKALEAEANRSVDIQEFVPLATIDPIYYESAHYLGPDKGAEKAYHLLAAAMKDTEKGALARFTSHGKENLVMIRPYDGGLVLHEMHYADEVRDFHEVDTGGEQKVRADRSSWRGSWSTSFRCASSIPSNTPTPIASACRRP